MGAATFWIAGVHGAGVSVTACYASDSLALTLGAKIRGPLLAFLTLPFFLPVIIFGILSIGNVNNDGNAEFYLLSSMLSLSIVSLPFITVKILQFNLEQ